MNATELFDQAVLLPEPQRAELVHRLLLTLEPSECDPDAQKEWAAEIKSRLDAYRSGQSTPVEWQEAKQRIRESLSKE